MSPSPSENTDPVRYRLQAHSAPDVLPRVLDLLAKRNLVPARLTSHRQGEGLAIEIDIAGLDPALCRRLAASMRTIVNVESVLVAGERLAKSA